MRVQQLLSTLAPVPLWPLRLQDEQYLLKLDPIVAQLAQEVPDAKYDRKSLASLIMQLRQFMEDVMGKNVGFAQPLPASQSAQRY